MKKMIFCSLALLTAIIGTAATVEWTGHCGDKRMTVDVKYFESEAEAKAYYEELNEIYCGSKGDYTIKPSEETKGKLN